MFDGEVLIIGGGFAGLTAAAGLAARGAGVTVLESLEGANPNFRGELIHPRGVRALDSLGLKEPLLEAGAVDVAGFAVTPGEDVPAMVLPYAAEYGKGLGVDHHAMIRTLRREVAARPNVQILTGQRVDGLVLAGGRVVGVRTADGREHRAELTVGADGRVSKVRALLGLGGPLRLLSYTVAVTVEGEVLPHPGYGHVFLGAPGPILAYPYGERRVRMCIDVPLEAPKGKEAIKQYVQEHYGRFVPEPLRTPMLQSLQAQPLVACATQALSVDACAAPGVALLGDAAGCSHPLTAAGMTNAMNDTLVLADCLGRASVLEDALLEYQRRRTRFVHAREVFTEALYEVFKAHDPGARALQAGTFHYWASSARARATSMEILSGEDATPTTFVSEYALVMGRSTADVLTGALRARAPRAGARQMRALFSTSWARMERTFSRVVSTMVKERRGGLASPTPSA